MVGGRLSEDFIHRLSEICKKQKPTGQRFGEILCKALMHKVRKGMVYSSDDDKGGGLEGFTATDLDNVLFYIEDTELIELLEGAETPNDESLVFAAKQGLNKEPA